MFDPAMELMITAFAAAADDPTPDAWARAGEALGDAREAEPAAAAAIDARDSTALRSLVDAWTSGQSLLPERDRAVLKRALKAYRKRLKVTRLDDESKVGGSPMSGGRHSSVVGVQPPERYPRAVWDELVRQGRLLYERGAYVLPEV